MPRIETTEWTEFPGGSVPRHVFAMTDLHGMFDIAAPLLEHLAGLPRLAEETVLVSCGDVIDRGPRSLDLVELVLRQGENFDDLILLCGNHEIMALDAFWQDGIHQGELFDEEDFRNWMHWGGESIYDEVSPDGRMNWRDMAMATKARLDGYLLQVGNRRAPFHEEGDLMFIHAGVAPDRWFDACLALGPQDRVAHGAHWAWMRGPAFEDWRGGWNRPDRILVHGHTWSLRQRAGSADEAAQAIDRISSHRRVRLDIGGYEFGHLAALEAAGNRYRFHIAFGDQP